MATERTPVGGPTTSHISRVEVSDKHGPLGVAFGRSVRDARYTLRISQEGLGVRASMHRNYIGAAERGEINPTLKTLKRLVDALGLTLTEFAALIEGELED